MRCRAYAVPARTTGGNNDIVGCRRGVWRAAGIARLPLVANAGATLLVLLVTTVLAVYKPRGMTRYGQRKQHEQRRKQREQRPVPAP